MAEIRNTSRKTRVGKVVSDKMDKTVVTVSKPMTRTTSAA